MGFSLFDLLENALGGDAARRIDAAQKEFASIRDSWGQDASNNAHFFIGSGPGTLSDMANGVFDGRGLNMLLNPMDTLQSAAGTIGDIGNAYGISSNGIDLGRLVETSIRNPISTFFLVDGVRGLARMPGAVAGKVRGLVESPEGLYTQGALRDAAIAAADDTGSISFPGPRPRPRTPKRVVVLGEGLDDAAALDEVIRASGFTPEEIISPANHRISATAKDWAERSDAIYNPFESKPSVRLGDGRNTSPGAGVPDAVRQEVGMAEYADGAIIVTDGTAPNPSLIARLEKAGKPVYIVDLRKGFPDSTGGSLEHLKFTDSSMFDRPAPDMSGVSTTTKRLLRPGEALPRGAKVIQKYPDGRVMIEEVHQGGFHGMPESDPVAAQMAEIKLPENYNPRETSDRSWSSVNDSVENMRARSKERARLDMLRRTDPAAYAEEVGAEAAASGKQPMKVVIAGTRGIDDVELVRSVLQKTGIKPDDVAQIVSGKAKGVDTNGATIARELGIEVKEFPANIRGKFDPFGRNQQMAEYGDAVVAVWDGESGGTADMIGRMRRQGKPVWVYNSKTGMVEFPDGTVKPLTEGGAPRVPRGTYEVSTRGDKRFSALHARVPSLNNQLVEEIWQLDKKGFRELGNDWHLGKGRTPRPGSPAYGLTFEESQALYTDIWRQMFRDKPDMLQALVDSAGDKILTDSFAQPGRVSQATALQAILEEVKQGKWPGIKLKETKPVSKTKPTVAAKTEPTPAAPPPTTVAGTEPKAITTTNIERLEKKYQIDPQTGELYYLRNAASRSEFGMGNAIWGDESRGARIMHEPGFEDNIAAYNSGVRTNPEELVIRRNLEGGGTTYGREDGTLPPELIQDNIRNSVTHREVKRLGVFVEYIGEKFGNFAGHPLANPFRIGRDAATKQAIMELYRSWLLKMYEAGKGGAATAMPAYEAIKRIVTEYKGGKQFVFASREDGGLTTAHVLKQFIEYLAHGGKPLP